jgi:hypothetical protein
VIHERLAERSASRNMRRRVPFKAVATRSGVTRSVGVATDDPLSPKRDTCRGREKSAVRGSPDRLYRQQ